MKKHRVDQVVKGKVYQGGTSRRLREEAEKIAKARKVADEQTGEYSTSYIVVEVEQ